MNLPKFFSDIKKVFSLSKSDFKKEVGSTGISNYQGYIDEDYNNKLSGVNAMSVYDQMRKSDAIIGASLSVCKMPILGANWYVEPASEDKADKEIADFIEKNLKSLPEDDWQDFLRQALLMLDFGVMVFEEVYQTIEWNGQTKIGVKKLAPRMPSSIQRWQTEDGEEGITQFTNDFKTVSIPMDKLLVFVLNKEGDNWWGRSMLRRVYKNWFIKNRLDKMDAIGLERQSIGVPKITLPASHSDDDEKTAEKIAKNLRASEKSFVVLPSPEWEAEFMQMGGKSIREPHKSIKRQDEEILLNCLAQFLLLGTNESSGSYSLSQTHSNVFFLSLKSIAEKIANVINDNLIKDLVNFNFEVKEYPKLKFDKLEEVNIEQFSNAVAKLSGARVLSPDDGIERRVREILNFPERDEDSEPREEPKEEEEKEAHEHYKKKQFSEDFWRPLTFAERKIDFKAID
ncbi:MAG: phage portal protein family protein, partial [Elusimicrobiota bacterium]